jgi:hypothetical protein
MSKKLLRLQEILKRIKELDGRQERLDFSDPNFPLQTQILESLRSYRFQGWQATRRGAKSTTFGKAACDVAANNPGSKVLYLALTLDSAKGILWDCIEKELTDKGVAFHGYEREGRFELDNGSLIRFFGVDSNYKEMKKILGQAYDLVGIDECGSMTIDMEELVLQMILAALSDREGRLVLLGTAENIPNTFFQKVMDYVEKSLPWHKWKWTTEQNPYMARQFAADKALILQNNPLAVNASWFKTHWMNEWCADDDLLIIKFSPDINEIDALPNFNDWIFGLGVDLGFNDASSFTVKAMSSKSPYLYTVQSFKHTGMDLTDVANTIKKLNQEYNLSFCEVDGANKQGIEEMQRRHDVGITLTAAEKTDKATFLRLMADDYKQGKIKAVKGKCDQLIKEQSQLMWIKDDNKEDPRCENHCNDSALYIWRKMRNYFKPEVSEWKSKDDKMIDNFLKEAEEEMRRMREQESW